MAFSAPVPFRLGCCLFLFLEVFGDFVLFFFLFKHISNCLPQKHLGLSRGLTIIH